MNIESNLIQPIGINPVKKSIIAISIAIIATAFTGCTRVGTGEAGARINFDRSIEKDAIVAGEWGQTIIGDIMVFPIKELNATVQARPLTADNSALDGITVSAIYSINEHAVPEIWSKRARSFHTETKDGEVLLMDRYIERLVNNATQKVVATYPSLQITKKREEIERQIGETVAKSIKEEKLDTAITLSQVVVTNIQPNKEILNSATRAVKAQNDLLIKESEVKVAKLEAERMAALSTNGKQSIEFMDAQSRAKIADGIAGCKADVIVVPMDFKGMVNTPAAK